jgi:hypothetical protein
MSKWTNEDIAIKTQSEGLGYMIQHYLSADDIEDRWLSNKWRQCESLLNEIQSYLDQYCNDDEW